MKTILRITTQRGRRSLLTYVAYTPALVPEATYKTNDIDAIILGVKSLQDYMPKQRWYWGVNPRFPRDARKWSVHLTRTCLVSKACVVPGYEGRRALMLWPEAFELWQAHVRML